MLYLLYVMRMLPLKKYFTREGWKEDYNQTKDDVKRLRNLGETLYWDLYYTIGYSSMAGLGNGLANIEDDKSFSDCFGEAYVNNFPLGMTVNIVYPLAFKRFEKSKNYRLYANLFTAGVNLGFLAWHYLSGTDNPMETMVPNTAVGLAMANKHVSETKKGLEEKLE